jgi:thioredoxin-related protein
MRVRVMAILLALAAAGLCASAMAGVDWQKDLKSAAALAAKDHKAILADFCTDWCSWCKKLDQDVYTDAKVQAIIADHYVAVKMDGDKERDLVKKYEVRGYPTIVLFDAARTVLTKIVGYEPAVAFAADLMEGLDLQALALEARKLRPEMASAKGPRLAEVLGRLGYIERRLGNTDKARDLLAKAKAKGLDTPDLKLDLALVDRAEADQVVKAVDTWLNAYPAHARRPEALLGLGMAQAELKLWAESVATLEACAGEPDASYWGVKSAAIADIIRERFLPKAEAEPQAGCATGT